MAKYRHKPIIVEAQVYQRGMEDGFDKCNPNTTCGEFHFLDRSCETCDKAKPYILSSASPEGYYYVSPEDYIVTGIDGEKYVVKREIFEKIYEPAGEGVI